MFLNAIKLFFIKKSLKRTLHNDMKSSRISEIQNIGLLIENRNLSCKQVILDQLVANGIREENVSILVFKQNFKKKESVSLPTCGFKDLKLNGSFADGFVANFIATKFDLLISYYEVENPVMLSITKQSQASFKAGFTLENYFFNDINVKVDVSNAIGFTNELVKYLKILNKL
ncbi:hypothetical protein AP058_00678 [Flavobacterium sp. TAB 87]|nr:hypothetical protein AP058_00678 [Flavobacterium sp. TAB 87]